MHNYKGLSALAWFDIGVKTTQTRFQDISSSLLQWKQNTPFFIVGKQKKAFQVYAGFTVLFCAYDLHLQPGCLVEYALAA